MLALLLALVYAGGALAGNPHGTPPGQAKQSSAQPSGSSHQSDSTSGVKPGPTTQHNTSCGTGGGQGSSATCPTPSAGGDQSKRYGNDKTAAQIANGRGAPAGTTIKGPGNSQPHKVCRDGHWVDVHAVKHYDSSTACGQPTSTTTSSSNTSTANTPGSGTGNTGSGTDNTGSGTSGSTSGNPGSSSPANASPVTGGVQGASKTLQRPAARGTAPAGILGANAVRTSATRATLPFTGMALWVPALLGLLLVGGGFALLRTGRSTA